MYTREYLVGKTLICNSEKSYLISLPENGKSDYVSLNSEKSDCSLNNYKISLIEQCIEKDKIWKLIDNTYQIY